MQDNTFLACSSREIVAGRPAILGCPLDMTSTYRAGTGAAPDAIRIASDSIETYSPFFDADLENSPFSDLGNLPLSGESLESSLAHIERAVSEILHQDGRPLCLGGEHTITLPVARAINAVHPGAIIIHLDAHTDLRDSYEGSYINHATVIRRVQEITGPGRLIQLGIRSGTAKEFALMREHGTWMQWGPGKEKTLLRRVGTRPVYLTLDLDVLDPACVPGTGNPEAGGWFYHDMERLYLALCRMHVVGADVVELNPGLDPSEVGTITAAKIVRELLLILGVNR
ncbi:MAG: agmatinase [Desulfomonilaceae bacterium]